MIQFATPLAGCIRKACFHIAAVFAVAIIFAASSSAQPGPMFPQEVQALAERDAAAALARVDAEIAALAAADERDVRTLFSLLQLKLRLLEKHGSSNAVAPVLVALGTLAADNRTTLDVDPLPFWTQAAEAFENEGNMRQTLRSWENVLALLVERKASRTEREKVLQTLARIAKTRGDTRRQAQYEQALAKLPRESADRSSGEGYRSVDVYYATDRARENSEERIAPYGVGRGALDYGVATVTIPANHTSGALEAPSIWRLEFSESSDKHVILKSVERTNENAYFTRMKSDLTNMDADEIFVFVHGFNVSFEQAVKRAAQLAHDMSFQGVPIAYSWPSRSSLFEYVADTAVVRLSGRRLAGFLEDVVARSGAKRVHLIAHSMGNRAMTDALELIGAKRQAQNNVSSIFDQVIFAAPDVDAGLFAEMVRTIRPLAKRLTLYASRNDWALKVSRKLHGDAQRAGQGGDETLVVPEVDSIDMSELGDDMLAHGYFADDSSALVDLASLFWRNASPTHRCGLEEIKAARSGGVFWRYKPGACDDQVMLPLIANIRTRRIDAISDLRKLLGELIPGSDRLQQVERSVERLLTN